MRIVIHATGYPLNRASYRLIRRRLRACIDGRDWPGRVLVQPLCAGEAVRCRVDLELRGGGVLRCEGRGAGLDEALARCLDTLCAWWPDRLSAVAPGAGIRE
ncbi:hypothetical protein [Arhodomonas sp. AD133]|uniref:hypothetical protein n=1 Tax=Arhodomonas sp. AD133 TaxID=3415009 RepID=UPI003EB8CDE3